MPHVGLIPRGRLPRPTLIGRAALLIIAELIVNAICWIAAGICFRQADGLLALALLAWTIGLRHGLDADHISAIDNATRQMVSLGKLPMTCGLYFSLGHSTIVIAVNVAIAISVDVYDKLDAVGSVGGIVGTAVSASFLFLVASINTYFLVVAVRERRKIRARAAAGLELEPADPNAISGGGCLVRIIAPVLRAVDKPWKMYPVGVLFGFGFDTASSIALLAISAIAERGTNGATISHGKIVILPFLFTAGMSLVDSLDSVLMLWAYAQPDLLSGPDRRIKFFTCDRPQSTPFINVESARLSSPGENEEGEAQFASEQANQLCDDNLNGNVDSDDPVDTKPFQTPEDAPEIDERTRRIIDVKTNTMSSLSISLTLLSILVALSISLIEIMGLIGENCASCQAAANDPSGGGLAGSWWRAWANANNASGYVGAAIVGSFVAILLGYHGGKWAWKRYDRRHDVEHELLDSA